MISDGDIVGKYVGHITGAGKVMNFLSSSTGFLIVIVLPMLLFFIYQVYNLIMISIRLKKAIAVETAQEQELARQQAARQNDEEKAQKEKEEAQAALEEARRMKEEAEALRAQAEAELARAKEQKQSGEDENQ